MAIKAICVSCGKPKSSPFNECKSCNYVPETEYQISRALIFSSLRTMGGIRMGREQATLKQLSKQVMAGRPYEFDPAEIENVVNAYRRHLDMTKRIKSRNRKILITLCLVIILLLVSYFLYL